MIHSLPHAAVRAMVEAAPDGILLADEQGAIAHANDAACELFGYEREQMLERPIELLLPGVLRAQPDPRRRRRAPLDVRARRAWGEEFPVEVSLAEVDVDGRAHNVAIVRDRSRQRRLELERVERARARAVDEVVSGLEAIVWESVKPDRSSLSYLGGSEDALLGYPREQWLREGFWLSVVHSDDRLTALAFAEAAKEHDRFELSYRLIAADGRVRHVRDIVTVVRDGAGETELLRGVIVDVTDVHELEQRLSQAQKMEAVGQLAGGIAHDFNNLLTVVSGYARLLLRPAIAAETVGSRQGEISQIVAATDKAAELTKQLLRFARRGEGRPELVDPSETARALRPMLRRLIDEDIAFELDLSEPIPPLLISRSDLEQVVMNLVLNARDAMNGAGGLVTVATSASVLDAGEASAHGVAQGAYVLLEVADTGAGIPDAVRARIFEPFFTTKAPGKGTGMGLATVYGIVEQNRGFIELDSEPGIGTTFRIGLPAAAAGDDETGRPRSDSHRTVLLVEDEEALRRLAERILREDGYTVLTAGNGSEAMSLAEHHHGQLDLLVTDVVMPLLSGPELVRKLRTLQPDLAVLYMSGYNDSRLVSRGIEESQVELLIKPFRPDELSERVCGLLARDA